MTDNEELCPSCGKDIKSGIPQGGIPYLLGSEYCPRCGNLIKQIHNEEESNQTHETESIQAEYIPQATPPTTNKYIEIIKGLGYMALFIVMIVAVGLAIAFLVKGTVWAGIKVYPYLEEMSQYLIPLVVLIFFPLSFVRKISVLMALLLLISSYVFGLLLWIYAVLLILTFWGWGGFLLSLFFTGGTVVPAAILAVIIHTKWIALGQIAIGVILVLATRFRSLYIMGDYD